MSSGSLLELFNKRRDGLERELDGARTLEEAARLLARHLSGLEQPFIEGLSPQRARLAGFLFGSLRAVLPILTATRIEVEVREAHLAERRSSDLLPTTITAAISLLLFISLLTVGAVPALISLILLGLVGRDFVKSLTERPTLRPFLRRVFGSRDGMAEALGSTAPKPQPMALRADSLLALRFVGDALDVIDRAIRALDESAGQSESRARTRLEDTPEVLDLVQELLGSALLSDATSTVKISRDLVPQVLRAYGLCAVIHDDANPGVMDGRFVLEPSIDPSNSQYITVTPAIITKDGSRVVRTGRVVEPTKR